MANDKSKAPELKQDDKAVIEQIIAGQSTAHDSSTAKSEQDAIVDAIGEDSVCVTITTAMPIGAALLAFNLIARKYGQNEQTPQEWAEAAIADGLKARERSWKYTADTQNLKAYREEKKAIAKLFTYPEPTHPKYQERLMARFEADQRCDAKYGIQ